MRRRRVQKRSVPKRSSRRPQAEADCLTREAEIVARDVS